VDGLQRDGRHLGGVLQASGLRVGKLCQASADGLGLVGDTGDFLPPPVADLDVAGAPIGADPLDPTAGELMIGVHVEQSVLEARRTEIGYEDLHGIRLPVSLRL
jgi:hypothetical protein